MVSASCKRSKLGLILGVEQHHDSCERGEQASDVVHPASHEHGEHDSYTEDTAQRTVHRGLVLGLGLGAAALPFLFVGFLNPGLC